MQTLEEAEYQEELETELIYAIGKLGLGEVLLIIHDLCHNQADAYCLDSKDDLKETWNTSAKLIEQTADTILGLTL